MTLPPELTADWAALSRRWTTGPLREWLNMLPEQFISGLAPERYGDLPRWRTALANLPSLPMGTLQLNTARVGLSGSAPDASLQALETALMGLHPWRKGPFELFGLHIDTEWRSDWKWDRLAAQASSRKARTRRWLRERLPLLASARCRGGRSDWY